MLSSLVCGWSGEFPTALVALAPAAAAVAEPDIDAFQDLLTIPGVRLLKPAGSDAACEMTRTLRHCVFVC